MKERHSLILDALRLNGQEIKIADFLAQLGVSEATIRRDLEFLEKIKAGPPEDGLLGAVGMEPELEEVAEKSMEAYQRRADDIGREVEI